jgi:hypothetical protein
MAEDLDDYRRTFDACPEPAEGAAIIFEALPQFGQCSQSTSGVWSWYLSICSRTRSSTATPQNLYATWKSPAKRRMVTDVLSSCATTVSAFPKKPLRRSFVALRESTHNEMKSVAWVSASRLSKIA